MVGLVLGWLTIRDQGLGWIDNWTLWCVALAGGAFMYWRGGHNWMAAGSQWVQSGPQWINTYEIVRIRFSVDGLHRVIRLKDSSGQELTLELRNAQGHPLLWDLVYNGLLHSVASGHCDISKKARKVLKL